MRQPKFTVKRHLADLASKINTGYTGEVHLANTLAHLRKALLKGQYYTGVNKVSASGMSRTITIAYIENNKLYEINNRDILKLAGCSKDGRIHGCGMDMLFQAQYNLFVALCPDKRYQDSMTSYQEL